MEEIEEIGSLSVCKEDEFYYLKCNDELVVTPGKNSVKTRYINIARELCKDIMEKGEESYTDPTSILYYHYTTIDMLKGMSCEKVLEVLDSYEWQKGRTFGICPYSDSEMSMAWNSFFGTAESRTSLIRFWLSAQSVMQLSAVLCVYKAFDDMNMAFLMAMTVDAYKEKHQEKNMSDIMDFYSKVNPEWSFEKAWKIFEKFRLYYGIHAYEKCEHEDNMF